MKNLLQTLSLNQRIIIYYYNEIELLNSSAAHELHIGNKIITCFISVSLRPNIHRLLVYNGLMVA